LPYQKKNKEWEMGRYGPVWPKTPACYGFTIVAKVKPGSVDALRNSGNIISGAVKAAAIFSTCFFREILMFLPLKNVAKHWKCCCTT
jgi:hypothetical protein